jgi:3-hydroxyisobutyrate dehydrogenase
VFAGGDLTGVEEVLAVFGTVVPCGDPPSAAAVKLVVNTALIGGLALLGELRELAGRLGVDAEHLLAAGPMGQFVTRARGDGAHFTTALAEKDLTLALAHAGPLTTATLARLRATPPGELGTLADPTGRP